MKKIKKRDIGQEILDGIRAIKEGKGIRKKMMPIQNIRLIRENIKLSQSAFAGLLNVSVRTLQDWEQGRRKPRGPAQSLLFLAQQRPEVLKEVFVAH